ncbi:MAG: hypothetical protein ACRD3P_08565 [Terriglobales bacterium]
MRNALGNRLASFILLMTLGIFTVSIASAQTAGMHHNGISSRGVPASVTSFGFGGHPGFHGVPASVTSQGFGAGSTFRGVPGHTTSLGFGLRNGFHESQFEHHRHHTHRPFAVYSPYYGGYGYAPYAYPYYLNDEDYSDSAAYQAPAGGDRENDDRDNDYRRDDDRQILDQDYRAGLNRPSEQSPEKSSEPLVAPVVAQPSTLLIFKDGHQQEISNYAIVGSTLYDLSDGRSKKVQLADLDLQATVKQNDQRGVEFQLPAQAQLN